VVPVDMQPLFDVAKLLYEGPWVAERHTVMQALIKAHPEAVNPVVLQVVQAATQHSATDAFEALYQLQSLRRHADALWQHIDVLMVPTAPTCPTLAAVAADPVARNSELGRYTNFVNLLGMAALALPASISRSGLPFGITLIAPGGSDAALAAFGQRWQQQVQQPMGHTGQMPPASDLLIQTMPAAAPTLRLSVVGAHLSGMPLHGQLVERHCRLVSRTRTAPHYRLYALPNTTPPKPGLARVGTDSAEGGHSIELEVYEMPLDAVGSFLALIPSPLGLGSVELEDGQWVKGFICEPQGLQGATDISHLGGWRAYIAQRAAAAAGAAAANPST
jgi:allophanate hydrolase